MEDPIKTYLDCIMPIALERSDTHKDWLVFRFLVQLDRDFCLWHLEMTKEVFDYNVFKLLEEEQDDLLGRRSTPAPRPSS